MIGLLCAAIRRLVRLVGSQAWMDEAAVVCQVEDGLTSAPRNLLNETEGVQTNR